MRSGTGARARRGGRWERLKSGAGEKSGMKCPFCGNTESRVKDSRDVGDAIHRRRECEHCKGRFSTYERVEKSQLMIIKRDQRREPFDRQKLFVGISKACEKRPLSVAEIENTVEEIDQELYRQGKQELPSSVIGELVMERLRRMDKIAYIRFASVYRSFNDVETMLEELQKLLYRKQADVDPQETFMKGFTAPDESSLSGEKID
jgi:transcriptional repressor NrdR